MKRIGHLALALALLSAPQVLNAQDPAGAGHHGGRGHGAGMAMGRMDPFARLLERRQELQLTSQQVSQIEGIQSRLRTQNQPLMEQLQTLRRQAGLPELRQGGEARGGERRQLTDEQRQAVRQFRERAQPITEQMRANTRTAMREVQGILTEQQRSQLRQWHQEQGRRHGRGEGRRGRGGRRGGV